MRFFARAQEWQEAMAKKRKIRVGVIGVGHFGRRHAEKYASFANAELVALCDLDTERAEETAAALNTASTTDYRTLLGHVDAVSVAVPTKGHFEVARAFLEAGAHVLVEKPITGTLEEADALVRLARDKKRILQVGHVERFSAAYRSIAQKINRPLYIESYRISPFQPRGTDVNVVLEVMIHDIDLLLALVASPVRSVLAVGAPILSEHEDVANARVEFESGAVANVTASRVGRKTERRLRIFQSDDYLSIDLAEGHVVRLYKKDSERPLDFSSIGKEEWTLEKGDALKDELAAFIDSVASGRAPAVTGEMGREALAAALLITEALRAQRERLLRAGASAPSRATSS
jgi:predicted dehydrogenase